MTSIPRGKYQPIFGGSFILIAFTALVISQLVMMVSSGKMLSIDNIFFDTFSLNIIKSKSTAVRWIFFYRLFTVKSRGPHRWIIFRNFINFSYGSILVRHFPNIFLLTRIDFSMLSMDNILLYEIYVEFLY